MASQQKSHGSGRPREELLLVAKCQVAKAEARYTDGKLRHDELASREEARALHGDF